MEGLQENLCLMVGVVSRIHPPKKNYEAGLVRAENGSVTGGIVHANREGHPGSLPELRHSAEML